MALDLRWAWSPAAMKVWECLDADLWHGTQNPWVVLQSAGRRRLAELAENLDFLEVLTAAKDEQKRGLAWFARQPGAKQLGVVAFFSMEYGFAEALPLYGGNLGVVAAEHLKSASDLGVPLIGIGLFYGEGAFRQTLDYEGGQYEIYPRNDSAQLPVEPLCDENGRRVRLSIVFPGRTVYVVAWEAKVGRNRLLLLDTNDAANHAADRAITARPYGIGNEERLQQELVLGIVGRRLLKELELEPDVCHFHDSHAAFAVLEHTRYIMARERCSFTLALRIARAGCLVVLQNAVESSFERFDPQLIRRYLASYAEQLGLGTDELLRLGRKSSDENESFTMSYFALRTTGYVAAVSRTHVPAAQMIFGSMFSRFPLADVPIDWIGNGIHVASWTAPAIRALAVARDVRDGELWNARTVGRERLVESARKRTTQRLRALHAPPERLRAAQTALDPRRLTIGFGRRFAAYRRPTLLLTDPERLAHLLSNAERPLQIILAGKAHPRDTHGKALIREWITFAERRDICDRVIFLEDYDLLLARELVQGVDVWLSTSAVGWENSAVSGIKAALNGALHCGMREGWWAQAFAPTSGFVIDAAQNVGDDGRARDQHDASVLYDLLEREIAPTFYERDEHDLPRRWLAMMRESMAVAARDFSSDRMVHEYVEELYLPAARAQTQRLADGGRIALEIETSLTRLRERWHSIRFGELREEIYHGTRRATIDIDLAGIPATDVRVELYAESNIEGRCILVLDREGDTYVAILDDDRPLRDFTARIIPAVQGLSPLEAPLMAWHDRVLSYV